MNDSCQCCGYDQETPKLPLCGNCKAVRYCSKECQRVDWKRRHKQLCGNPNNPDYKGPRGIPGPEGPVGPCGGPIGPTAVTSYKAFNGRLCEKYREDLIAKGLITRKEVERRVESGCLCHPYCLEGTTCASMFCS